MKKFISLVLAVFMMCALLTCTAFAGTSGTYTVTYEAISVASGDIAELAADDTFYATINLTGAEGIFSGVLALTWDNTVITPVKTNGVDKPTSFAQAVLANSRIDKSIMVESEDEGEEVEAFEMNSSSLDISTDTGSIGYEFSAAMVDGAFNDYLLDGDQLIVKIRFRVLKDGNANLQCTNARVCEVTSDGTDRATTMSIPALVIGGGEPDPDPVYTWGSATDVVADETGVTGTKVAVFGKVSGGAGKVLADNEYWVTFGENTYYGKASTSAVTAWAIVIYDPEGKKVEAGRTYGYTAGMTGVEGWTGSVTASAVAAE